MAARFPAGRWLPPFALMAVIFLLSAQPNLSSGLGLIDLVGRKLVHAAEFGLLCVLWWRALRTVARPRPALVAAALVSVLYAASDEYHQSFVAGRSGNPLDVLIDTLGIAVAWVLLERRHVRRHTTVP